jgi:hypothetical protein
MANPFSRAAVVNATGDGLTLEIAAGNKGPILLKTDKPIAIPGGAKRLSVWANPASMGNAAPWRQETPTIIADVRDAAGTLCRYPFAEGSLNNRGWGVLSTEELSLPPFELPWKPHPQKPLVLEGLEVHPGGRQMSTVQFHGLTADTNEHRLPERPWQVISLNDPGDRNTAYSWQGAGIEYTGQGWTGTPFLTMDAVTDGTGSYRIGVRMREGWEGPIVKEWEQEVILSAANPAIEKRTPLFVAPPHAGTYFMETRTWGTDYTLRGLRYWLLIVPGTNSGKVAARNSGVGGRIEITTGSAGHVFAANETPSVTVQVKTPQVAGKKSVHILLTDYGFNVLKEETLSLAEKGGAAWKTTVNFPKETTEACRAFVKLRADDRVVDKDCIILGKAAAEVSSTGAVPGPGERFYRGVTSSSFLVNWVAPEGLDTVSRVSRGMDQAVLNGNRIVEIQIPWRDLEPLPGLYQFGMLDKIMALAQAKGLKANIVPWDLSEQVPRWLFPNITCYDDCTSSFIMGSQFAASASAPRVRHEIAALWRAIAHRYRGNPALAAYQMCGPSLDLGYWHSGILHRTDYSPSAVDAFRSFLKEKRHYSLADVSARYGNKYATWDEVYPPAPDWKGEYDFRPQWVDFCAYQQWELRGWMERSIQAVRKEDPLHAIYQYNFVGYGPQEYYYPLFKKYGVSVTTGGSEGAGYTQFISTYNLWGFNSRGGETIQTVEKWNLYKSLYNMLAYGGGGAYYEVQWHSAFPEPWDTEPDGEKILREWATHPEGGWQVRVKQSNFSPEFAKWSKIFDELGDTRAMPTEAGSFYSWERNLYQYRWLNPYSVTGGALLKAWDGKEHILPRWISDDSPLELYRELKMLVVDADTPAMTRETAGKLTDYVRGGGCLVTFAPAGQYTVETGRGDFGFLAGLGFAGISLATSGTTETVTAGDGLFKGEALAFKSLYAAQMPAGTEVLAKRADGSPCVVRRRLGTGEVILFLGELDWAKSGDVLGALCQHRGVTRWCDATDPRVHVYSLQKGDVRYVVAQHEAYNYGKELSDYVGKDPIRAKLSVAHLANGVYSVSELNEGRKLGEFSSQQLNDGVELGMVSGETKILIEIRQLCI